MRNNKIKNLLSLFVLLIFFSGFSQEMATPFAVADKSPVFPGCESLTGNDQKDCTVERITNHVNKNFNTALGKELNLTERQRIVVKFVIGKDGEIRDVESRSLAKEADVRGSLQAEATRVIKSLPKMQAGEFEGEKVAIAYALPIEFATPQKENKNG
ncbi:energy transducer TonB [uncultured Christiangramia sp.]|uniref:energy transducer TonB n=1 Tax=uncultured Christiangramia sp. TaxID=503836 RepID=UPI002625ED7D|nr:energy transducer TonB [uncultured Christiangramia sp.]